MIPSPQKFWFMENEPRCGYWKLAAGVGLIVGIAIGLILSRWVVF